GNNKIYTASQRDLANMRCAIAALAAERYRQEHGAWPATLAEIAPNPLPESWTDPYDCNPLRYRKLADGVVIYTLGPDGQDNGGNLSRKAPIQTGTDLGMRLWDADLRPHRQK